MNLLPSKEHLFKSNREVSDFFKTPIFTSRATNIGISWAFQLLHVGWDGFEFVGHIMRVWSTANDKYISYGRSKYPWPLHRMMHTDIYYSLRPIIIV